MDKEDEFVKVKIHLIKFYLVAPILLQY